MGDSKSIIDVDELEKYYLSLMTPAENGKRYISIQTMEKMMLLEIYKTLCAGSHDDINNGNQGGKN